MTEHPRTDTQGFLERHHFLMRRLHSLTGIVPIGVFLIAHLVTNSSLAWGAFALRGHGDGGSISDGGVRYFAEEVIWINDQVPHLLLIEITLWVSIAFHALLGLYYATTGKGNATRYAYQDNWRYSLQRWSGYVGILFIFYHVATLRWGWTWLVPGGTKWDFGFAASTLAMSLQGSPDGWTAAGVGVSLLYFLGVSLLVFHFANGLWTAAITWGVTVSVAAQRRWGVACFLLGAGLMAMAWSALAGALLIDPEKARAVETEVFEELYGPDGLDRHLERHGGQAEPHGIGSAGPSEDSTGG